MTDPIKPIALPQDISAKLQEWGKELGFQAVGISSIDLSQAEVRLLEWLKLGYHGEMDWMQRHGSKRSRPAELIEDTLSIISVRMDYLPPASSDPWQVLSQPELAYISRYALGRDYHKVLRQRLEQLAQRLQAEIGAFGYRVFTDSAPVLEKPIAVQAGLGWMGKHTNVLSRDAGSWFFLGEIYTTLPLAASQAVSEHCGHCRACLDSCPTNAFVAPYVLDARLCISYLTIEYAGSIPLELRPLMGNRIYGCDDCQLVCPWNRFATPTTEADFAPRHALDAPLLVDLLSWDEATFLKKFEGSPIRRIGYERWVRNIAVALGNAPVSASICAALQHKLTENKSELVQEHLQWALQQHNKNK